jgi:hypothetical protein
MAESMLPPEFSDLEPHAEKWCRADEPDRWSARMASSMAEIQEFYDAITARAEEAIAYCDKFPLDDMPEDAHNLLYMLYSMVTVSFPVECWGQPRIPDTGAAALDLISGPKP